MRVDKKQEELDKIKWDKSVALGFDACGSFDYCSKCNKDKKNPCANAYSDFFSEELEIMIEEIKASEKEEKKATKTAKKESTTTKKCTKKAETAEKKETKKAGTKKTTAKSK